jgi:hypothetical protein
MSTVEKVALWSGLISSIVSIVLSIVAIVFAVLVDRAARNVTAQTVKSLQKIESEVDRSSSDTRDLIKAAWEKMLVGNGMVQAAASIRGDAPAKEIAAGTAAELREDLREDIRMLSEKPDASNQNNLEKSLNEGLQRFQESLVAQIRTELLPRKRGTLVDQAWKILDGLSGEAKALAVEIASYHLTRKQYKRLLAGPLSTAISELRHAGILVPLTGQDKAGQEIPVYWFPSRLSQAVSTAIPLITIPSSAARDQVKAELERVGYYDGRRRDS